MSAQRPAYSWHNSAAMLAANLRLSHSRSTPVDDYTSSTRSSGPRNSQSQQIFDRPSKLRGGGCLSIELECSKMRLL